MSPIVSLRWSNGRLQIYLHRSHQNTLITTSMNILNSPVFFRKIFPKLLSIGVFCFAIWQYVVVFSQFEQGNTVYAKGICCGFTEPVFAHIFTLHTNTPVTIDFIKGYASVLSAFLFQMQDLDERGLLRISQGAFLLSMTLCYLWGILQKKPVMGAFAAYVFSVMPILVFASFRWDVFILAVPIVLLALILVRYTRGFTCVVPTLLYCLLTWCAAFWSSRETDNFLLLFSMASIACGHWLQVLWNNGDQRGRVSRYTSSVLAVTACSIILLLIAQYTYFTSPEGAYYYFREAERSSTQQISSNSWVHRTAYWGHLYWRGIGPSWGGVLLGALGWLLLRKKISGALLFAFLCPLLALSLLSKKNFYYGFAVWGVIPLVISLGVFQLPRWGRIIAMTTMIWLGQGELEKRRNQVEPLVSNQTYGGIFQTSDQDMSLQSRQLSLEADIASVLQTRMPQFPCDEARWIASYAPLKDQELEIRLKKRFPCTIVKRFAKLSRLNEISVFLISSNDLPSSYRENLTEMRFEAWGRVPNGPDKQIEIWGKSIIVKRNIQKSREE